MREVLANNNSGQKIFCSGSECFRALGIPISKGILAIDSGMPVHDKDGKAWYLDYLAVPEMEDK